MFLDADRHPVARTLEDHWLEIREEMRALRREDYESIADPLIVGSPKADVAPAA